MHMDSRSPASTRLRIQNPVLTSKHVSLRIWIVWVPTERDLPTRALPTPPPHCAPTLAFFHSSHRQEPLGSFIYVLCIGTLSSIGTLFSTFLMLHPLHVVPPVVATPSHKIILLLLQNCNFLVMNCNINI